MNEIYIFVKGGCVEDVLGTNNYSIIDFDSLESGMCPVCGFDLLTDNRDIDLYCRICKIDWDNIEDYVDLIESLK